MDFYAILDLQKRLKSCPLLEELIENFEKLYDVVGDEQEALHLLTEYYREKGDYQE